MKEIFVHPPGTEVMVEGSIHIFRVAEVVIGGGNSITYNLFSIKDDSTINLHCIPDYSIDPVGDDPEFVALQPIPEVCPHCERPH